MTILIVHYHLRSSGVTRVIQTQRDVLQTMGHKVIVASAGPVEGWEGQVLILPQLDYGEVSEIPMAPLMKVGADLWIIHNPTLGLNSAYPRLIESAIKNGIRLLLQIHDFVEDGRPCNYKMVNHVRHLYPDAPQIHYATINRRDRGILMNAGIPPSRCHFLPNAVDPPSIGPTNPLGNFVFYPVRGIRRKNLGELCLLAAHAPPETRFAVALRSGPEEPPWIHDQWVEFAKHLSLPVSFDVAGDHPTSFVHWLEKSSHLITTSISEGFGLTFLDPAFLKKPLIGRDLPEITRDFSPYGTLYSSIPVPLSYLPGLERLYRRDLEAAMTAYGRSLTSVETDQAWSRFVADGEVDFGNLPELLQRHVIENHHLPWLETWLREALVQNSGEIDTTPWSLERYLQKLARVIQAPGEPGEVTWIPPNSLLEQFLSTERFHFLRAPLQADHSMVMRPH